MIDNVIKETYVRCYEYAKKVLYLPKGIPELIILDSPSNVFQTVNNACDSNYTNYRVRFNRQWAQERVRKNDLVDIELHVFHELRHIHQYAAIERYHSMQMTGYDSKDDIEAWAMNLTPGNYIYNDNSGRENLHYYNAQPVEADANAYAMTLLCCYHYIDDVKVRIGMPPEAEPLLPVYRQRPEIKELVAEQERIANQRVVVSKVPIVNSGTKIGPNDQCPCGSGKKFKKCKCEQYHPK